MRATKNKWLRAITGVSLILGLILGVQAFEKQIEVQTFQAPEPVTVYFEPSTDDELEILDESNWSDTPNPNCGFGQYLCKVTYDASLYRTLRDFLDANPSQQEIIDNSMSHSLKN